jgi:hypothetical protein
MNDLNSKLFSALAFALFDRRRSSIFCIGVVSLSVFAEMKLSVPGLFSCSGAIVSIAGLFLNIKYSLNFHLKIPKIGLYNKLAGAGVYGTATINEDQERWMNDILGDEMFGVAFMIIGTLIWAYGSYLMPAVASHAPTVASHACK